ncbi:hypothetical protein [Streptomyces sp. NBC_01198]|uniref:hypothetical protein n=1 Tax=Streptomyces sp. NBC_01198 TaxID=2903769 RepID=UPI002E1352EF|nr:hypothetical protein OG702_30865 [Streptomyces sp. NBC_01198]
MTGGQPAEVDPAVRAALAADLLVALRAACPGSTARLRGSLAAGTADRYSDIDIAWQVPAAEFGRCVAEVRRTLARVGPLRSLRSDPEFAGTPGHRLLFAAFHGLPLFWRLDLDVHADRRFEATVPADSPADPWSPAASALANAVAAVKAVCRGRSGTASGLLGRGLLRVGAEPVTTGDWRADLARLTAAATAAEPGQRSLAAAVDELAAAAVRPASGDRPPRVVGEEAALEQRDQGDRRDAGDAAADDRGGR